MSSRGSARPGYGPNASQVERLLQEWETFEVRDEDVAKALANAEHRRRMGDITEREQAVTRMLQIIKDDSELKEAAVRYESSCFVAG